MPILLLGALGGILGMFIGAVFLEDGYKVFMERVEEGKKSEHEDTEPLSTS
jgi:hypothetical protein